MRSIAAFVIVATAAQLASVSAAPDSIEAGEIANYTVIKEGKDYEIRSYPPAKWACRDLVTKTLRNRDQASMFFDLFDYITGQNSESVDIDMTAPVSVYTKKNADAQGNTLFQMCFYVPEIHQANPPMPTGGAVYMEDRAAMIVAASRFGGFMKRQRDWTVRMDALKAVLKANNEESFDFNNFYGATYDSPYKFTERRNEVWLVKMQE